ncbi:hypothetical protein KJ966_24765 [bacterium]|nr:hypothetical protein [bacterium]
MIREQHEFCSEFYSLTKAIEVVVSIRGTNETVRIEILKDERTDKYHVHTYIKNHVTLQPTYPQTSGSFDQKTKDFYIWVDYDLPWVIQDSADVALNQALGFLKERCSP